MIWLPCLIFDDWKLLSQTLKGAQNLPWLGTRGWLQNTSNELTKLSVDLPRLKGFDNPSLTTRETYQRQGLKVEMLHWPPQPLQNAVVMLR